MNTFKEYIKERGPEVNPGATKKHHAMLKNIMTQHVMATAPHQAKRYVDKHSKHFSKTVKHHVDQAAHHASKASNLAKNGDAHGMLNHHLDQSSEHLSSAAEHLH